MILIECIVLPVGGLALCFIGVMFFLGRRVLYELMRPGVLEPGSKELGGLILPEPEIAASFVEPLRRPICFRAQDGTQLAGEFWAQPGEAVTVVVCHGYRFPSRFFEPVAALCYSHGANVLIFDFRGHPRSQQTLITCGVAEVQDLAAAVEVAISQPETASKGIFLLGFSMGAAVALMLPQNPEIVGIIADSAYARLDDVMYERVLRTLHEKMAFCASRQLRHFLIPLLARLALAGSQVLFFLRYRRSLVARPDQAIRQPGKRSPLLLIHDQKDPFTGVYHANRLVSAARTAGHTITTYYTSSAIHCGSYGADPERYLALLREFIFST